MQLAIPVPRSPLGMVYRSCANNACVPKLFLLGDRASDQSIKQERAHLMRRLPGESGTTCPYCGEDGDDADFLFQQDVAAATEQVAWAVKKDAAAFIEDTLQDMARSINSTGGRSITARYTKGQSEPPAFVWREDLLRNLTCDTCTRAYGVYAIGLFCPDCGAQNVHVHFEREIELVRKQIELAKSLVDEELSYRLLGNAHEDVLTALETYLKTIFRFLVQRREPGQVNELCSKKAIGNSFQNVDRARRQFSQLGLDPYKAFSDADLSALRLNIEKRHVVGHNLSMADEGYAKADQTEEAGQTIRILSEDISAFANLCGRAVRELEADCPEFLGAR